MIGLDQIESQFRAAVKERPVFERPAVGRVLVVSDRPPAESEEVTAKLRAFLAVLEDEGPVAWETISGDQFDSVRALLKRCEESRADLIVTWRHLHEREDLPYSLGTYCDMLTQVMTTPILLVPKPSHPLFAQRLVNTDRVMVVTDRIVGERKIVDWGLRLCETGGQLHLAHVEDDRTHARYVSAISRIPDLDTEVARKRLEERLLDDARDYMADIAEAVKVLRPKVTVHAEVRMGHAVRDFKALLDEHEVDILVLNTKDEDQLAMHGVAYSLGVEVVDRPLLML